MRYYLRRSKPGSVVHSAVREGGGKMEIMMTACGRSIRWDLPHRGWERAKHFPSHGEFRSHVTCRRCLG